MTTQRRLMKMKQVLANRQKNLSVVCENIHDPHNVSAILRTCDAVGVQDVYLLYTIQAFPKLSKESSSSAVKWIDTHKYKDTGDLKKHFTSREITIYGTHLGESAISIYDVDWTQPSAIIFGNEHSGISEEALTICNQTVSIPMFGMIESLNVSVAAAAILYEAARQRLQKGLYPRQNDRPARTKLYAGGPISKLAEKWINGMLEKWIKK